MKLKDKKELKFSNELIIGDKINVGNLLCVVIKVEDVFYYVPEARVRLTLRHIEIKSKREQIILFLPSGVEIETLK